jgi:hypothetical protein
MFSGRPIDSPGQPRPSSRRAFPGVSPLPPSPLPRTADVQMADSEPFCPLCTVTFYW